MKNFKSKQEVILNEFQPIFDDYKLAVDSYNENVTGLQEQKKDVEALLNTYQEEFEEYEKERLNAEIQQEKSNEIYFKFRETAANLQALTDMNTLQNNNIAMLADLFQKNQENAIGQGKQF